MLHGLQREPLAAKGGAKGNANKSQQPPPPPNKGSMFKQLGHNQQSPDFFLLDLCSKQDSTLKEVFPKPQPAPSPSSGAAKVASQRRRR